MIILGQPCLSDILSSKVAKVSLHRMSELGSKVRLEESDKSEKW